MSGSLHTSRDYSRELAELRDRLLTMGSRCEDLIEMASRAMVERDADLAARVERADAQIDLDEIEIDELAIRILALRQPKARDLRFVIFALKVVVDLERIGDEAANMAERAGQLTELGFPVSHLQPRLQTMSAITKELVHQALQAFLVGDNDLAREVRTRDDEVDALYGEITRGCLDYIRTHPEHVAAAQCLASTSRYLERIADHATNIAEMVVYVTTGKDVRHPYKR